MVFFFLDCEKGGGSFLTLDRKRREWGHLSNRRLKRKGGGALSDSQIGRLVITGQHKVQGKPSEKEKIYRWSPAGNQKRY